PILSRMCDKAEDDRLDLSHIPQSAAHVLVHFLYTGTYKNLEEAGVLSLDVGDRKVEEFRSALHVFAASRAFELANLEILAKKELHRVQPGIAPSTRLSVASEICPNSGQGLRGDDPWLLD